ncbi:MAG TPA: ABC transporter transmembrane domain-containing protein [Microbacteriaceae bacterium]|nr:ABC transporter transmembrane domain-containing protein [Microbacteriaceae bacterium]
MRLSPAVAWLLVWGCVWALLQAIGMLMFAASASAVIVAWFDGRQPDWPVVLWALIGGAVLRAIAVWAGAQSAARGAARAKAHLREAGMRALATGGALGREGFSRTDVTLLLTRGLDALDEYFGQFLPQLLLELIATPLLWCAILLTDGPSALVVAIVIPVIPVFMVLIGRATESVQSAQLSALTTLGRQFADVVEGIATLKIFRREREQSRAILSAGEAYRRRTMAVLRLSFLSGFTLELAATLSVAIVAVLVGTRLIAGEIGLAAGLFVLLVIPDVFAPVRQVGASFHAAADGLTSANALFALLDAVSTSDQAADASERLTAERAEPNRSDGIVLRDFSVARAKAFTIGPLTATFEAGRVHALVGPSGSGKSSLIAGILGFAPSEGNCSADHTGIAWGPQRPSLTAGSVLSNIALGAAEPNRAVALKCLARAGASDIDLDGALGAGGSGLSGGQAQRVSIARALYRLETVPAVMTLILDEPSSALDEAHEAALVIELRRLAQAGVCVIVATHRRGLAASADRMHEFGGAP